MSRTVGNGRALRALYVTGAFAAALLVMVVMSAKADAQESVLTSFYGGGDGFDGQPTASGEIFDSSALTAAHPSLPFGTQLEVCYQSCTVVTVNDRGPFAGDRGLDLSRAAADAIGLTPVGVDFTQVTVLGEGGSAAPAPEPAAEPAPEAVPAAEPVAAEPQAAPEVSQSGGTENVQLVEQNVEVTQNVNVFEIEPGLFLAEAVVPVNGDFAAAQAEADRIAQETAQAAANGAIAV